MRARLLPCYATAISRRAHWGTQIAKNPRSIRCSSLLSCDPLFHGCSGAGERGGGFLARSARGLDLFPGLVCRTRAPELGELLAWDAHVGRDTAGPLSPPPPPLPPP